MNFSSFLTSSCDIQTKTLNTQGYEQVQAWANSLTGVACRKDSTNSPSIGDAGIRTNTNDDLFFFNADVAIARGNRIVFDAEYYDVIKVNKSYGAVGVHHLEVVARLIDHD